MSLCHKALGLRDPIDTRLLTRVFHPTTPILPTPSIPPLPLPLHSPTPQLTDDHSVMEAQEPPTTRKAVRKRQLMDLPAELLEMIAARINSQSGLNAFVRTNRYLYQSFNLHLWTNQIVLDRAARILQYASQRRWKYYESTDSIKKILLEASYWLVAHPERQFMKSAGSLKKDSAQVVKSWSPLAWAATKGNEHAVKLLLELKDKNMSVLDDFCVDAHDPAYRTPLSYAAEQGHVKVVRMLLDAGADPNVRDVHFARTPLLWAGSPRLTGRTAVPPYGEQIPRDKNPQACPNFSPVETYFKEDVPGFSQWNDRQEKKGEFIFDIENTKYTAPLTSLPPPRADLATYNEILDLLIQHGASLELPDTERRTPLAWAAACGYTNIVESLLRRGAVMRYAATPGVRDPISWAAEHGHWETVEMLILWGASPLTGTLKEGKCPLTLAASNGHSKTVKILIDNFYSCDIFAPFNVYTWPLTWASRNGHKDTLELLLKACNRHYPGKPLRSSAIFWAAYHGFTEVVKILMEAGLTANTTSRWDGMTPLQVAAMNRHVSTVKFLLESRQCPVNAVDKHSWSAYSWVAKGRELAHVYRWGQPEIKSQKVLEMFNKDPAHYRTICQLKFEHGADHACQEIKKLLLEHGADPTITKPEPKSKSTRKLDAPHAILQIFRTRDTFSEETNPVSIR